MTRQLRCLVIEDSQHDQLMIKRAIASAGVDTAVDVADTLDTARDFLAAKSYAIILCDNSLPDGNGADLAQELADEPKYRNTSIVIVSGWPTPFMWAKAKAAGLRVIDKNDQPQAKLSQVFKQKCRTTRQTHSL